MTEREKSQDSASTKSEERDGLGFSIDVVYHCVCHCVCVLERVGWKDRGREKENHWKMDGQFQCSHAFSSSIYM